MVLSLTVHAETPHPFLNFVSDSRQNNATVVMRLASGWKGDANFRPQIWRFEKIFSLYYSELDNLAIIVLSYTEK